jgi:hypothetical protein
MENQLNTIQKRNNLNTVFTKGKKGNGMAYHQYTIQPAHRTDIEWDIQFQNGARFEDGSTLGFLDVDLLEIVRNRLQSFQQGGFSCRENAIALTHIEEALLWMNKRVEDRAERDVLETEKV